MGLVKIRPQRQGATNELDSDVLTAHLMGHDAQKMQRIGVVGILGENLPIKRLSLWKLTRTMMLKCELDRLMDGDLWHLATFPLHAMFGREYSRWPENDEGRRSDQKNGVCPFFREGHLRAPVYLRLEIVKAGGQRADRGRTAFDSQPARRDACPKSRPRADGLLKTGSSHAEGVCGGGVMVLGRFPEKRAGPKNAGVPNFRACPSFRPSGPDSCIPSPHTVESDAA